MESRAGQRLLLGKGTCVWQPMKQAVPGTNGDKSAKGGNGPRSISSRRPLPLPFPFHRPPLRSIDPGSLCAPTGAWPCLHLRRAAAHLRHHVAAHGWLLLGGGGEAGGLRWGLLGRRRLRLLGRAGKEAAGGL